MRLISSKLNTEDKSHEDTQMKHSPKANENVFL